MALGPDDGDDAMEGDDPNDEAEGAGVAMHFGADKTDTFPLRNCVR